MEQAEFDGFFEQYSKNVDAAEKIAFWRFSDILVEDILKPLVAKVPKGGVILDAGGGTARWIVKLAQYTQASFVLYDLSKDMIAQARYNISDAKVTDRVTIIEGDLCDMNGVLSDSIDLIYSNYGVISFVSKPERMFEEFFRILKKDGTCTVMGHGYYNALYAKSCNIGVGVEELLEMYKNGTVNWAPHVPKLRTFSQETLKELMQNAGLRFEKAYGLPCVLQPGPEDFDPENKLISRVSKALEDKSFFAAALEIERDINDRHHVVNRGVNILAQGSKSDLNLV